MTIFIMIVCVFLVARRFRVHTQTDEYIYAHVFVCIHVCMYMYTCVHAYVHIHTRVCMYMYIYIHVRMHTHTDFRQTDCACLYYYLLNHTISMLQPELVSNSQSQIRLFSEVYSHLVYVLQAVAKTLI